MGRTCRTHVNDEKCTQNFSLKTSLGDLGVYGKVKLNTELS